MPSKFRLRYLFKPLVRLISIGFIRIGITPNFATVIMLCFSIISFITLGLFRSLLYFSIFVFITGIMDGCDGTIARLTNNTSKFGGFFDSFMDRISEFFIFLGLYFYSQDQLLWNFFDMKLIILISFSATIMISYTRARAEVFFKGDFDIGLMARSERLFYLVVISVISYFFNLFNLFLFIFMFLVLGTYIFRWVKMFFAIKKKNN
ncbi:MAG: CDP-alcohol phosphatidyltransferase family protein [Candidatus Lokiarchaeia archaeon]|nr:CDP-alcohol phosphatidyltransferase family protein [Candidatus Lokiarchaeia archaeon]